MFFNKNSHPNYLWNKDRLLLVSLMLNLCVLHSFKTQISMKSQQIILIFSNNSIDIMISCIISLDSISLLYWKNSGRRHIKFWWCLGWIRYKQPLNSRSSISSCRMKFRRTKIHQKSWVYSILFDFLHLEDLEIINFVCVCVLVMKNSKIR